MEGEDCNATAKRRRRRATAACFPRQERLTSRPNCGKIIKYTGSGGLTGMTAEARFLQQASKQASKG